MAEDVKVLRIAAERCELIAEGFGQWSDEYLNNKTLALLCTRMADMIEREERDRALMFNQVEAYSYDQGWDAALAAAEERMRIHQSKWQAGSVFFEHFTDAIRDVRALRREPRP